MSWKTEGIFKGIVIFLVLGLISVSLFSMKLAYAQAGQVTLPPTDNVSVSAANPNLNEGGMESLGVGNGTIGSPPLGYSTESLAWLKFNLSSVPDGAVIDGATLQLYSSSTYGTNNVNVYSCLDNSWTESTLTYASMPSFNTTSMDTVSVEASNQWYNWDVADVVTRSLNSNSELVTIVMGEPIVNNATSSVTFDSKEFPITYGNYSPSLTIYWNAVVPEFPTFIYLPFFMIATPIGVILYKRKAMQYKRL
jgi:hypothetical protein